MELVLRVVDRLYVMDAGRVIAEGTPSEVMATHAVRAAYLGAPAHDNAAAPAAPPAPKEQRSPTETAPVLELRDVHASYGEFAPRCSGSTSCCARARSPPCSGRTVPARRRSPASALVFSGRRAGRCSSKASTSPAADAHEIARRGVVHVPEGRSVLATLTVEENLELSFRALEGRAAVPKALQRAYELFPRLGERRRQVAGTLSGGEQRMLSLARAFPHPPRLLVADELSLGLAPIIVEEVFAILGSPPRRRNGHPRRRATRQQGPRAGRRCVRPRDRAAWPAGGQRPTPVRRSTPYFPSTPA